MRTSLAKFLFLISISFLGFAQAQSVQLTTTPVATVILGPNSVLTTVITNVVFTITQGAANASATPLPTGNSTASGSRNSTNITSSTTPSNLPTAPTNVDGGGDGGAPSPGAKSPGGIYGPNDSYTSDVNALNRNALLVALVGVVVGGALVFV